jgi:tRNA 5-methylaminomethyl-2-thiouridine biosynthesis bifunctional protein
MKTAIVIGAGIAGCASAYALAQRGWQVTLLERHQDIAQEASGNPRGVLYPRLASHSTAQDRLSLSSYLYTLRLLKSLNLNEDDFQACGLLQLAFNERESTRLVEIAKRDLAADLLRWVEREEASAIAGIQLQHPAVYFASAGWVNPQAFCHALIQHPNITLELNQNALTLTKKEDQWQVQTEQAMIAEANIVVIANANDALKLNQSTHLPITPVRGQMSSIAALGNSLALKTVVCTDGYLTPAQQGVHCLGATFSAQEVSLEVREADNQTNLSMLRRMSPDLNALRQQTAIGRAALRCATPDYLPMLGELLDIQALKQNPPKHVTGNIVLPTHTGLYANLGHGSKGLITAPFCAEILASQICQEPLPIKAELTIAINPNRYALREMGLKRLISYCALR